METNIDNVGSWRLECFLSVVGNFFLVLLVVSNIFRPLLLIGYYPIHTLFLITKLILNLYLPYLAESISCQALTNILARHKGGLCPGGGGGG